MGEPENLRQFIRDIARRHERIWHEQRAEIRESVAVLREQSRALREVTDELRDTRDERRAHTAALWKMLDRLDNGGAQA